MMRDVGFEPNNKRNTEMVGKEAISKDTRGERLKMNIQEEQTKRSVSASKTHK